jgi:hypothetical protein
VVHRSEHGSVTTWATPPLGERLSAIFRGEILFGPRVGWVVLVGLIAAIGLACRRPSLRPLVIVPPAYLLIAHGAHRLWPGNDITLQLANRGLGYAGLIAVLPLAALLSEIPPAAARIQDRSWRVLRAQDPKDAPRTWGAARVAEAVALAVAVAVGMPAAPARAVARQQPPVAPEMPVMAERLAQLVPDGARFATERDFPGEIGRTGVSHPDLWLAARSGRNTLNIFNLESSPAPQAGYESERIDAERPGLTARALARMGVTHLVTVKPATAAALSRYPAAFYFEPELRQGTLALFKILPIEGRPDPATLMFTDLPGQVTGRLTATDAEHLTWQIGDARPGWVTLAIGWSPKWRAEQDGRPVGTERAPDGLLRVRLPGHRGQLQLRFHRDGADSAGALISCAALLVWLSRRTRRWRQASSPRMSSSFSRTA